MDPFHVVALAGAKLDLCRQRIQQQTPAGTAAAPAIRSTGSGAPCAPAPRCSPTRQNARLEAVFADDAHVAVEVTWAVYQRIIAAYAHPDRRARQDHADRDHRHPARGVPTGLDELAQLGRTLHRRRDDVLAYFDHHASNGPTEAINGRLEALRRNALGFRNLTHYRIRSLLHCGNLAHQIDAL